MNSKKIEDTLQQIGLTKKEVQTYLALVKSGPVTLHQLAKLTGINRTSLYRIAERLQHLGLVNMILGQKAVRIVADKPAKLQVLLAQKALALTKLQEDTKNLVQTLQNNYTTDTAHPENNVFYFEGVDGLKQILWNTLKSNTEVVGYGYTNWNENVGKAFANKMRSEIVLRKIKTREIQNDSGEKLSQFNSVQGYEDFYQRRFVPKDVINIDHDTYIYDDVLAFFYWLDDQAFGIEIHNASIANTQRQIFEVLWQQATPE